MLPIERRHRIKELIQSNKTMKISELSRHFSVSEMTIHRDIKPLIEEGFAFKTFGGVSLAKSKPITSSSENDQCIYCKSKIKDRTAYLLILQNNQIERTCCPHCGIIRQLQLDHQVVQALCQDFLTETTISAHLSYYVLESSLHTGCCHPHILTFQLKDYAEKFTIGFGGSVYTFEEIKKKILTLHTDSNQTSHS